MLAASSGCATPPGEAGCRQLDSLLQRPRVRVHSIQVLDHAVEGFCHEGDLLISVRNQDLIALCDWTEGRQRFTDRDQLLRTTFQPYEAGAVSCTTRQPAALQIGKELGVRF